MSELTDLDGFREQQSTTPPSGATMERMSEARLKEIAGRNAKGELGSKSYNVIDAVNELLAEIDALRADLAAARKVISPDDARREANKLMATPAYTNRDHPKHASVVEQVTQLFERAYTDLDENSDSWRTRALAAEAKLTAAQARVKELETVGKKILAKLDSETASVTQWDADELRAALSRLAETQGEGWEVSEEIVGVAISYKGLVFSLERPERHGGLMRRLAAAGLDDACHGDQGFITSTGRFVDRTMAVAVARRADQTPIGFRARAGQLFSEDLW